MLQIAKTRDINIPLTLWINEQSALWIVWSCIFAIKVVHFLFINWPPSPVLLISKDLAWVVLFSAVEVRSHCLFFLQLFLILHCEARVGEYTCFVFAFFHFNFACCWRLRLSLGLARKGAPESGQLIITANTLTHIVNGIYKAAGISGATSHSGRRTGLTNLAERGVVVRTLWH